MCVTLSPILKSAALVTEDRFRQISQFNHPFIFKIIEEIFKILVKIFCFFSIV